LVRERSCCRHSMQKPIYVVVTPVRNEQENLKQTISSMVGQTLRPAMWVIVNDGSSDDTGRIADEASSRYDWIRVLHRADRGFRQPGGGVMEAFRDGYQLVEKDHWDFIAKLDGDLSFDPHFFSNALERFSVDSRLGIGGGTICRLEDDQLVAEWKGDPPFHVRGATKIYRGECWRQLGFLYPVPGWDTLDEIKANMLGWRTYSFSDLKLLHHRQAGEADGAWSNWFKNGRANYISGYHPLFMLLKCAARVFREPYGIGALGLLFGFVSGYLVRVPQIDDTQLIDYLRREQIKRLLHQRSLWG
jgi:biofilm PGA synthesis N-glycosyltransferase PgaC